VPAGNSYENLSKSKQQQNLRPWLWVLTWHTPPRARTLPGFSSPTSAPHPDGGCSCKSAGSSRPRARPGHHPRASSRGQEGQAGRVPAAAPELPDSPAAPKATPRSPSPRLAPDPAVHRGRWHAQTAPSHRATLCAPSHCPPVPPHGHRGCQGEDWEQLGSCTGYLGVCQEGGAQDSDVPLRSGDNPGSLSRVPTAGAGRGDTTHRRNPAKPQHPGVCPQRPPAAAPRHPHHAHRDGTPTGCGFCHHCPPRQRRRRGEGRRAMDGRTCPQGRMEDGGCPRAFVPSGEGQAQ